MITPKTLDFSDDELVEMFSWPLFDGFTADSCGQCKATANVPIGPGWICVCGHFNTLPWSNHQIPHDNPMNGPSQDSILAAIKKMREGKGESCE